jgi:hypothetical protein
MTFCAAKSGAADGNDPRNSTDLVWKVWPRMERPEKGKAEQLCPALLTENLSIAELS